MKKFFSLLCATLLVFSASAAPVAKKAELVKKAPVAVEQMQKVQFEKAQPAMKVSFENAQPRNFNQLNAAPAVKVINQKAAMQPKQMVAKHLDKAQRVQLHQQAANVARAPKRVAQSEELTITESDVDDSYVASDGEWDIYLLTTINETDVIVGLYGYNETLEGTYDLATNMNEWSCVADVASFGYYFYEEFTACNFTVTALGEGQYSCGGSFSIESGDFTFSTTLSYAPHVPQVYEITASDFSMVDYGTDMYMTALDAAGNKFFFDVYYTGSFELGKTYTLADMDPDYSWYKLASGDGNAYTEASITVTEDQDELLHVVADVVLDNGDSYSITYDEKAFVPTGVQINVNATNYKAEYISYYGEYVYTASNTDFDIALWVYTDTELGTFTDDVDIEGSYLQVAGGGDYVIFHSVATPIVVAKDEDGNKSLTGSLYAKNGDEYVFNLTYEKPDAKYIDINVANATLTNKSVAGFWTISGQTADKNNSFNIYFISKALQGTWTDVEKFDAYSTWVSDKSSGSNVYYENLSEVNLISAIVADSLVIEGTLNLADANGNPAIVTVHISTPFTQTWGDWEDFAPFDLNTGKYTFTVLFNSPATQRDIPVQVRKDNTGFKQFKFIGWGKQIFTANGIDLIVDMGPDYVCTVPVQDIGVDVSGGVYGENAKVQDYASKTGQAVPSTYDPETGTFDLALSYFISLGTFGSDYETMVMDQPILERDTVDVISNKMIYNDFIASNAAVQYYAGADAGYTQFCVTSKNATSVFGTFDVWADYSWINFTETTGTDIQEGQITVTEAEDGVHLTGYVIGNDEKYYRLNWFMKAGILPSDTDAPFDATFAWKEMDASIDNGVISISVQKGTDLALELILFTDPANTEIPEGVYTISDSQEAGTALQSIGYAQGANPCFAATLVVQEGKLYLDDMWFLVEGTITLSYDEYGKLKVVVDAKNSYGQDVTALVQYEKLEPKSTVDIVSTNLSYTDEWYAQYGIQEFVLTNDNYGVLLDIFADTLVGEFTEEDVDFADSYIVDFNTGAEIPVVNTGDIVVTLDGKNLALTATLIGADTIQYNISATGYLGAIMYDSEEAYAGSIAMEDVTITKNNVKKQATITGITTTNDSINIIINTSEKLVDGKLPAGVYEDIEASTGVNDEQEVIPSFVWSIKDETWFIQSGKLTVAEDGSMKLEGINSYDKSVVIDFTVPVVPTTFNVTVPEGTDACYLVGTLNAWNIGEPIAMTKVDDTHYTYTDEADCMGAEYKYVHGADWKYVEKDAQGGEIGNRVVNAEVMNDTVAMWADATGWFNPKANVKAAKQIKNGQIVIVRENKEYNILGAAL